jgi:hypothetical protein
MLHIGDTLAGLLLGPDTDRAAGEASAESIGLQRAT